MANNDKQRYNLPSVPDIVLDEICKSYRFLTGRDTPPKVRSSIAVAFRKHGDDMVDLMKELYTQAGNDPHNLLLKLRAHEVREKPPKS